jgi:uncharacterized membrane protein YvbJ
MPYCPKCGNQVDETVAFCPRCGTSLKGAASPEPIPPEQTNWNEKTEKQEAPVPVKGEKKEKTEHGFVGYLMGGLILVTIGIFGLLDLTNPANSSQDLAAMLLTIGIIIVVGAIYMAVTVWKPIPKNTQK